MDDGRNSISPNALYARLGSESAPIIIDARRDAGFPDSDTSRHDLRPQAAVRDLPRREQWGLHEILREEIVKCPSPKDRKFNCGA